eukprot:TRINITY_DN29341_c0_g1_i1.p1 TRINITY_DN29341_c0_g1~~TRINITY_DN29341_c0_g1_i1.p1  ORF type:complete len:226 (-),score=44.68 TRINITY_DN29341_c0_g1_i1:54-731(-)
MAWFQPWQAVPMPPLGSPRPRETPVVGTCALELARKPYRQVVEEVIKTSTLCRNDFDHKILLILDALHERGRLNEACAHVKEIVKVLPRDHVTHWRGYLHKLLRDFDEEAYHSVKAQLAVAYAERLPWIHEPCDHHHLRVCAADFHPGHLGWIGAIGPSDFAAVAAHSLHANAPEFGPGKAAWGIKEVAASSKTEGREFSEPAELAEKTAEQEADAQKAGAPGGA